MMMILIKRLEEAIKKELQKDGALCYKPLEAY